MIPLVIAVFFFILVLFFGVSVYYLIKDKEAREKEKMLKALIPEVSENNGADSFYSAGGNEGKAQKILGRFLDLTSLESLLMASNVPLSLDRLLVLGLGTGTIFVLIAVIIFRSAYPVLPAIAAGVVIPFLYVVYRKKKREETLVEQLPDALDMIVRALRIGQSVDGALREVARSFSAPLGTEIKTIYDEMSVGLPFEKAFRNFERKFSNIPEVKILVTAFIIQRETGGNLTGILDGVAKTVRERFQLKRQIKVLTAEGRLSAIILGLLPVGFLLAAWVFNKEYTSILFTDPTGKKILFLAILFEAAGFTVMRIMSRIRV